MHTPLGKEFNPAVADCGSLTKGEFRAPLVPHLARPSNSLDEKWKKVKGKMDDRRQIPDYRRGARLTAQAKNRFLMAVVWYLGLD